MKKVPTHLRLVALLTVIAAAMAACGGGKPKTQAKPAAVVAPTTTDPQSALRTDVLTAFSAYHRFYEQVIADPNPRDPGLAAHFTGTALAHMQQDLVGFQSTHEGVRLSDVTNDPPVIVSIDSGRAVIDECTRSIAHYFDVRTGKPEGAPPATAPSEAGLEYVFVMEAGAWKLSEKNNNADACRHA